MCWLVCVTVTQTGATWDEKTSSEEPSLLDWPVSMFVGHILD